ncbi:hypothetical protein BSKO_01186 [Bryopsis sp. KO-2023]|nr:hypothetical protein BSKO_01186 [Bryopsis sp. KO-2023]
MDGTKWTGRTLPIFEETGCIYLDYNATTPIYPEVAEAMNPFLHKHFGNPSSKHIYGTKCHGAVEDARKQVAGLIGCSPSEIYFTSCGTESNNWAIWGSIAMARKRGLKCPHVVTSAVEHPAVLNYLIALKEQGLLTFTAVPVTEQGLVRPQDVIASIDPESTVLVSIMHSNNEVGAIQPLEEITAAVRQATPQALIHCDGAQSLGKVSLNVQSLGVDMLSIVGHKLGAPKGVAALYIRSGVQLEPLLRGGGQEAGSRPGTENVLQVVGLGMACEIARKEATAIYQNMMQTREKLHECLISGLGADSVHLNGPTDPSKRLPNTLNVSIDGLDSNKLLSGLGETLAASAGSACHSGEHSSSPVLEAMKVPGEAAKGTLRLSTGRHTTLEDVARAAEIIVQGVK